MKNKINRMNRKIGCAVLALLCIWSIWSGILVFRNSTISSISKMHPISAEILPLTPINIEKTIVKGTQVGVFQPQTVLEFDGNADIIDARIVDRINYSIQQCTGYNKIICDLALGNLIEDIQVKDSDYIYFASNSPNIAFEIFGFTDRPIYLQAIEKVFIEATCSASAMDSMQGASNLRMSAITGSNNIQNYMINPYPIKNKIEDCEFELTSDMMNAINLGDNIKKIAFQMDYPKSGSMLGLDYLKIKYQYNTYDLECIYNMFFSPIAENTVNVEIRFLNHPNQTKIEVFNPYSNQWIMSSTLVGYGPDSAIFSVPKSCIINNNQISIRISNDVYSGYDRLANAQNIAIDGFYFTIDDIIPPQIQIIEPSGILYGINPPEIMCYIDENHPDPSQIYLNVYGQSFKLERQSGTQSIYRLFPQSQDWTRWLNYYATIPSSLLTLNITALDIGGNLGWMAKEIEIDKTKPIIGSVYTNTSNNICGEYAPKLYASFTDDHPDRIEMSFLSTTYHFTHNTGNQYEFNESCDWDRWDQDWNQIPSGSYSLGIIAYDTMGNYNNSVQLQIIKDTDAPLLYIMLYDGETYGSVPVHIKAYAYDVNLAQVWMMINGSSFDMVYNIRGDFYEGSDSFKQYWATLGDGLYNITIFASDYGDHISHVTRWIYKDTTSPSFQYWTDSTDYSTPPIINIVCSDSTTNIYRIYYTFNPNPTPESPDWILGYAGSNSSVTGTITIDSAVWNILADGFYTLSMICYDTSLNFNLLSSIIIRKDTIGPSFTINMDKKWFEQPPSFIITMKEEYNSIWFRIVEQNYSIFNNGSLPIGAWEKLGYSNSIPIQFFANDTLGNILSATMYLEKLDSTPVFQINTPQTIYNWKDVLYASVQVDSGIVDSIYIMINGSEPLLLSDYESIQLNLSQFSSSSGGLLQITVIGNNSYLKTGNQTIFVTILPQIINESEPSHKPLLSSWIDFGIIIGVAAVTACGSYLSRRYLQWQKR